MAMPKLKDFIQINWRLCLCGAFFLLACGRSVSGEDGANGLKIARSVSLSKSADSKPNIVLINLDDADLDLFSPDMLSLYPSINKIATGGVQFTNLHVTTPFCGPSRASLFRGQYAHRCGVRVNIPQSPLSLGFAGGYSRFLELGHDQDELGVWMKNAGYRTMMIGKYHHNGFDFRRPPGWDDFFMSNGGRYQQTYRFTTRDHPDGKKLAPESDVYRTDQEASDAVTLIRRQLEPAYANQPFFLYIAPLAPHRPVGRDFTLMVDKEKYGNWHPELVVPPAPDFNEADISDKPSRRQPPLYTDNEVEIMNNEFRCRARAVKSVDDLVRRVFEALDKTEQLENTFVFFTSDNGYQLGHHRLHNKLDPYERCTRVPLYVMGPGVKPGQFANHLLAHFDICATILELADGKLPAYCDSKSFAKLVKDPSSHRPRDWREFLVIENWQAKQNRGGVIPGTYSGLRLFDQTYIEWATGDKSFYDLSADPFQLENSYESLTAARKIQLKENLLNSRSVEMEPIVTITDPSSNKTGMSNALAIHGVAEDDHMVREVLLTIEDLETGRFWAGDRWADDSTKVMAQMAANDQQISFWHYPLERLVESLSESRELKVTAWSIDASGTRSKNPFERNVLARRSERSPKSN
jgi:arylsulfatase A-like enzyme